MLSDGQFATRFISPFLLRRRPIRPLPLHLRRPPVHPVLEMHALPRRLPLPICLLHRSSVHLIPTPSLSCEEIRHPQALRQLWRCFSMISHISPTLRRSWSHSHMQVRHCGIFMLFAVVPSLDGKLPGNTNQNLILIDYVIAIVTRRIRSRPFPLRHLLTFHSTSNSCCKRHPLTQLDLARAAPPTRVLPQVL